MAKAGGDYFTTYWPQASYMSSRRYYVESSFEGNIFQSNVFRKSVPGYHELDFNSTFDRNTIYWHYTVPASQSVGKMCKFCKLSFIMKPSLMELVQAINPGQPELPEWVYNGAILGVQVGCLSFSLFKSIKHREGQRRCCNT